MTVPPSLSVDIVMVVPSFVNFAALSDLIQPALPFPMLKKRYNVLIASSGKASVARNIEYIFYTAKRLTAYCSIIGRR
jgi:hypothetical protein